MHTAINMDTARYRHLYQEKKATVQLYLDKFFKKADNMPSASTLFSALKSATYHLLNLRMYVP